MIYIHSRVKLPAQVFTKIGSFLLQTMQFKSVDHQNMNGMIYYKPHLPTIKKNVNFQTSKFVME